MLLNQLVDKKYTPYLEKIVESESDGFFVFSISKDEEYTIDFCSDQILRLLDLNTVQIHDIKELFATVRLHPQDSEIVKEKVAESFLNYSEWTCEFRIITTEFEIRWLKVVVKTEVKENEATVFFGKLSDITSYKVEIEQLKVSTARNQFANETSGVGVWDWDLKTNKVFYSKESLKILELDDTSKHLIDSPEKWDERVHPNDREIYYSNIQQHFEGKSPYYETCHRVFCNNRYKWILDKGKVICRDNDGKPLRIVGTHTDVTLQKEKEKLAFETLRSVNNYNHKLVNFTHIVSHNLRNHTGNLSLLIKMKEEGDFETEEAFTFIKSVSKELNDTIYNLLELVKIENAEVVSLQLLNLNKSLLKVFTIISEEISTRKVVIDNRIPSDLKIQANPAFLESILLNLTTNAIKYSVGKKDISIGYYIEEKTDYVILSVKDNGIGIDLAKHKEDIFGLYKTFHETDNSNGIGLYITKNQIENMGGKIEVESEVNIGSTFKVYFKK